MIRRLLGRLNPFRRGEDGSASIEFIVLLPGFILLFLSSFELGMLMTRHVMLDRGLDIAVRDVRLGTLPDPSHDGLVDRICEGVLVMKNCTTELKLEMRRVNPTTGAGTTMAAGADCVNRDDPSAPPVGFVPGQGNWLMLLRACALFDPWFPTTGLGSSLPQQPGGGYALVATSSYVIEP